MADRAVRVRTTGGGHSVLVSHHRAQVGAGEMRLGWIYACDSGSNLLCGRVIPGFGLSRICLSFFRCRI